MSKSSRNMRGRENFINYVGLVKITLNSSLSIFPQQWYGTTTKITDKHYNQCKVDEKSVNNN